MQSLDQWLDRALTDAIGALRPGRLLVEGGDAGLDLPILLARHETFAVKDATRATEVLLGLVAGLNRDKFVEIIAGQVSDLVAGRETMTSQTRAKKLAAAEAAALAAELAEERVIRSLEALGLDVARRPDADASALLAADACLPS